MSSFDPTDIRSQERAKAEQATRNKLVKDAEEGDIEWLVSTKRGRRIVWRLLDQSGVFRLSFNSNSMTMAFQEGNRNSGNRLLSMINNVSPDAFCRMLKESKAQNEDVQ